MTGPDTWRELRARMRLALDLATLIGASAGVIAAIVGLARGVGEPPLGLVVMIGLAACGALGVLRRVEWTPSAYLVLVLIANVIYLVAYGTWFGLGAVYVLTCAVAFVFFSPRWAWLVAAALATTPLAVGLLHAAGVLEPHPFLALDDSNTWIRAGVAAARPSPGPRRSRATWSASSRTRTGSSSARSSSGVPSGSNASGSRTSSRARDAQTRFSQLAAEVGADIGAALAIVEARARSLATSLTSDDSREALDDILHAMTTAGATMHSLTAFSPDAPLAAAGDASAAVRALPRLVRRALPERIELTCQADGEAWVGIDTSELARIGTNLVFNARDAIEGAGTIAVTLGRDAGFVTLDVRDTGSGMTEDTLTHLFQPFFTTKPVGRGTGLGLATTLILVERAHGTITVVSELGRGTTFSIRLPLTARG